MYTEDEMKKFGETFLACIMTCKHGVNGLTDESCEDCHKEFIETLDIRLSQYKGT